jgi:CheY-like chemotaxis protein
MDQEMPVMDGSSAAREIRALEKPRYLKLARKNPLVDDVIFDK